MDQSIKGKLFNSYLIIKSRQFAVIAALCRTRTGRTKYTQTHTKTGARTDCPD